jgi:hypothetical protein
MAGAYLRRNVRPLGEAQAVAWRLAAPGLALVAAIAALGGAGGFASLVLLAAIVAGSVRLLEVVGRAADGRSDRFPVAMAATGLAFLVAAGVSHVPLVALGVLACVGLERLGELDPGQELAAEPAELPDAPISRAA